MLKGLGGGDTIKGLAGNDKIYGGNGADFLYGDDGADELYGDAGDDNLHGGAGKDTMHGFGGRDTFRFESISDSAVGANRDHIVDLFRSEGDRIDLSVIDARTGQSGNQAFSFIGASAFSASGQVRVVDQANGVKLVQISNDGDLQADMEIMIGVAPQLGAQDFVL